MYIIAFQRSVTTNWGFVQMAQFMKKEKQSLQAPPDIKRHVYLI